VTLPPLRPPRSWNGEGEVLGVMPLLCAEGGEEESQFGLVAPEDVRPTEAETMILLIKELLPPPPSAGLPSITRQRVTLPLKIFD
jgi:hypothetical protein